VKCTHFPSSKEWGTFRLSPASFLNNLQPTADTFSKAHFEVGRVFIQRSYMLGAGVPSDHVLTPTKKTDSGGKVLSWG
jgi:hypothetical protein